jgi:hypothetical protein
MDLELFFGFLVKEWRQWARDYPQQENMCKGWTWNYSLEGFSCERMDAMGPGLSATENTCKGWTWNYSLEGFSCERMDAMGPGLSARANMQL